MKVPTYVYLIEKSEDEYNWDVVRGLVYTNKKLARIAAKSFKGRFKKYIRAGGE